MTMTNIKQYPWWQSTNRRHRRNWSRMRLALSIDSHRRTIAAKCTSLITAGKKLLRVFLASRQRDRKRRRVGVAAAVKVGRVGRHAGQEWRQRTGSLLWSELDRCLVVCTAGDGRRPCAEGHSFTATCQLLNLFAVQRIGEVATVTCCYGTGCREARLVADVGKQFTFDADSRGRQWRCPMFWRRQREAGLVAVTAVNCCGALYFLILLKNTCFCHNAEHQKSKLTSLITPGQFRHTLNHYCSMSTMD